MKLFVEAPIYNDTIPLCLVDSNDTLELVGSTDGTWSTPLQTSLCQQNICNLTDLSYNLGGIYTFHSNAGSREVNVVIKGAYMYSFYILVPNFMICT